MRDHWALLQATDATRDQVQAAVRGRHRLFGTRLVGDRLFHLLTFIPALASLGLLLALTLAVIDNSPFPDWQRQAWAGALVLTGIVLALELGVRWVKEGRARVPR